MTQSARPSIPATRGSDFQATRFAVRYHGGLLILPLGKTTFGRSHLVDVVLDSPTVSRHHASIEVGQEGLFVHDLGSRNGVLVNGRKIRGGQPLLTGDRVQLGEISLEVQLLSGYPSDTEPQTSVRRSARRDLGETKPQLVEQTRVVEVLELLSGVVDKALAMGHGHEAARLIGGQIDQICETAERTAELNPRAASLAATYAIRLASSTGDSTWIDRAVRIYHALGKLLPAEVIHELPRLKKKGLVPSEHLLQTYLAAMRTRGNLGKLSETLLDRLEELTTDDTED